MLTLGYPHNALPMQGVVRCVLWPPARIGRAVAPMPHVERTLTMLRQLYATYSDPTAAKALVADCRAAVVQWRWATESMAFATPFLQEKQGGPKARWVADDKADPARHVRHGFDAQGRMVIECGQRGTTTAWLDAPERRALLNTTDDFVVAVADNTGSIDPLPGLRKAIGPERWTLLKARGCV